MLFFALISSVSGDCPVANPNPSTMSKCFQDTYNASKGHLPDLTAGNKGAQIFLEYVQKCEATGNKAFTSNELDLQIAPQIGGTTLFYNNKSAHKHLDIYGGDLLVIPSQFFKVVNDAQKDLEQCAGGFKTLLASLVESGLTKAINDGAKGKNDWDNGVNSVLMDSHGPGKKDDIKMCLHLWPSVSVHWMHLHVFQDQAWEQADSLWNGQNTCTKVQKPSGDWTSLLKDKEAFKNKVNHLADLLACNMGDGSVGDVQNFDKDTCPKHTNSAQKDSKYADVERNETSSRSQNLIV